MTNAMAVNGEQVLTSVEVETDNGKVKSPKIMEELSGEEDEVKGIMKDDSQSSEVVEDSCPLDVSVRSHSGGMKVLFLSSDTGGGHRASAESLAKQFQILFPGTTYELLDIVEKDGVPPYNSLVSYYKHLSAHPSQWKLVYSVSNSRAFEMLADAHLKLMCERAVRKRIKSYSPDVVVSVHPLMTNVPVLSCSKISNETGKHLPMFTVVTDLGSAHCLWFANGVEKMFIGSDQVKQLAKKRGKVPDEKLVNLGLPIRHDFAVQAEQLGDRMSPAGRAYQLSVRQELGLPRTDRKTILVMGGGEGVGSLSNIVDGLYVELTSQGIDALVLVVCGRNKKLQDKLAKRDWLEVYKRWSSAKERHGLSTNIMSLGEVCGGGGVAATAGCIEGGAVTGSIRRMLSHGSLTLGSAVSAPMPDMSESGDSNDGLKESGDVQEEKKLSDADAMVGVVESNSMLEDGGKQQEMEDGGKQQEMDLQLTDSLEGKTAGHVHVEGLGFITNMAEYMVAADVLVSKAGPGTISEAAALSLPVLLTSYLPGQEEGNVDYVLDGGFGAFVSDSDPIGVGEEVCMWLQDDKKMEMLSKAANACGSPHAARDIAKAIGESTLKWIDLNEERVAADNLKRAADTLNTAAKKP